MEGGGGTGRGGREGAGDMLREERDDALGIRDVDGGLSLFVLDSEVWSGLQEEEQDGGVF